MYYLSTTAHEGPQQPTKAYRPTKMENSPNDGEVRVFLTVHFIFYFLYYQPAAPHPPHLSLAWTTATKAHEGPSSQRRPTQAHEEGKRPICIFFLIMYFSIYFSFFIFPAGCPSPTTPLFGVDDSHKSPRRPQQPTKANAGPRRGKTAHMYFFFNHVFFNLFFIFYIPSRLPLSHHTSLWRGRQPQKPTKAPAANEGRRRPTKRENGPYVCFF